MNGGLHPGLVLLAGQPVVHRHRGPLRLEQDPVERADLALEPVVDPLDERLEAGPRFVLDRARVRAPDVEAVAAGHDQVRHAHELLDHGTVAPGDHAHRAAPGQPPHHLAHARREDRVLRARHDRGQRAVVIKEHRGAAPGDARRERAGVAQRVGEGVGPGEDDSVVPEQDL